MKPKQNGGCGDFLREEQDGGCGDFLREEQDGGCGCNSREEQDGGCCGEQFGGVFSKGEQNLKRDAWLDEVREVRDSFNISWKEAMVKAMELRKKNAAYQGVKYVPTRERYKQTLASKRIGREHWEREVEDALTELRATNPKATRKEAMALASRVRGGKNFDRAAFRRELEATPGWTEPPAHGPYGHKNKRPVTMEAAKQILLKYYRDRATNFKKGPLSAMKRDISMCKDKAHTLTPCTHYTKTVGSDGKEHVEWFPEDCRDSWKYRPGKFTDGRTGPGVYDIDGLDNLCKKQGREGMKKTSKLYNMKGMHKKPVSPESRAKRSAAMKAKWASMTPEQRLAIQTKRAATLARKQPLRR